MANPEIPTEKTFFVLEDGRPSAQAYTVTELKARGTSAQTFVWSEGQSDWARAGEIAELAGVVQNDDGRAYPPTRARAEGVNLKGAPLEQHRDLLIAGYIGTIALAQLINLLVSALDLWGVRTPLGLGLNVSSSLLWIVSAGLAVLLALLIQNRTLRAVVVIVAALQALYTVFNTVKYSMLMEGF